jgi:hypothetical protein
LIVPNLGAFNGSVDCTKWMGLMKVWLHQIGCLPIAPNGWVWWRFDYAKLGALNEEFRVFDCPKQMGLMKGWSHQIGCLQWRFWLCLMGGVQWKLGLHQMGGLCFEVICKCTKDLTSFYLKFVPYRHEHTLQDQIGKTFSQDWQLLIMKSVSVSHAPPGGWVPIDWFTWCQKIWCEKHFYKVNEFWPSFDHNSFLQVCSIVGQWHWQRN